MKKRTLSKKDRSRILTASVVTFLCVVFIAGFIYGLSSVLAMEGAYPPSVNAQSKSPIPTDNAEMTDYLKRIVDVAEKQKPAVSNRDSFNIVKASLKVDGSEALKETLLYLRDGSGRSSFDSFLEDVNGDKSVGFSEDSSEILISPDISPDDIVNFNAGAVSYKCSLCEATQGVYSDRCLSCDAEGAIKAVFDSYVYYRCPSCGEKRDTPADNCELCGGVQPYAEKYKDEYTFTLEVNTKDDAIMKRLFGKRNDSEIRRLIGNELDNILSLTEIKTEYNKAYIIVRVNRLNDEITHLEYRKEIFVTVSAEFIGDFSSIGKRNASFILCENNTYDMTWPSITLSAHEAVVEPKGNSNLLATLTCDDATKYDVKWSSSDDSLLKVDDEGYYVAEKKEGFADITASFEFNGKTYSDTCRVYVRHSVESSKISKRKLSLDVGETAVLTVKLKPANATVQTVKWYTDNAAVAEIDENGRVTAKGKGTATVWSLSDDGYFRSSCEVTVK